MRRAVQQRRAPTARPMALPAPNGGWNTRDSLDGMAPQDAVILDNWYPGLSAVSVRPGSATYSTGLGGTVETLAEFNAGSTRKLLGAANGKIFDCSSSGAVGAALASGFTSNRWQTVNFSGHQFWVNGADTPQTFDGSAFGASGWTGPTVTNLVGVAVFKTHVIVWEKNSQKFWYGPAGAITGALSSFDLSTIASTGGNILAFTTLSYTGGATPDDLACFILTSGEVIVYQGTDPSNAANWSIVGKYQLGAPVGVRAVAQYGGDSYITTLTDHTSLNSWFGALRTGVPPQLSKASGAVQAATAANASAFGWQAIMFPSGGKMLFNVPNSDGTFTQHVLNTITQAWCRYVGLNASCWSLYRDQLFFGGAGGKTYQAETGNSDSNATIVAIGQQAWSQLKSPYRKRVAAFRPIIESAGTINYEAGLGYDYQAVNVGTATSTAPSASFWDVAPWDTSKWGADMVVNTDWRVAGGSGQSVGVGVSVAGLQQISWLRTDLRIETGINF